MVRNFILALVMPLVLIITGAVRADDGPDLEIEIKAPIQAIDAVGNTITVLGLTIAVPASALEDHHHGGKVLTRKGGADDGGTTTTLGSFIVGQFVEVKLATDVAPLTATEVSDAGAYVVTSSIHGTVQAVDSDAKTVTVLGAVIDISTASFEGSNDDDSQNVSATAVVLTVGQSAEISLDDTKFPSLVATRVEVKNFTNQVGVELEDHHGNHVGDNDTEDTIVDATQSVKVIDSVTGKRTHKSVHIHTTTRNGSANLTGLALGKAKLVITRNGKSYRKTVTIAPNGTSNVTVKVK